MSMSNKAYKNAQNPYYPMVFTGDGGIAPHNAAWSVGNTGMVNRVLKDINPCQREFLKYTTLL